jgi:hypothetical protein
VRRRRTIPKDPFEGFNRAMFAVNEGLDVVVKPVAQGYDAVAPLPVKVVIGNFFGNIWDAWTAVNNLLQGKGQDGALRCRSGADQQHAGYRRRLRRRRRNGPDQALRGFRPDPRQVGSR